MVIICIFCLVRASLHRIRTDQILEFGWLYLLPLSLVNLVIATFLRLEVWTESGWPIWAAPVLTITALFFFVVYAIDEDEEALSQSRRPYSTDFI